MNSVRTRPRAGITVSLCARIDSPPASPSLPWEVLARSAAACLFRSDPITRTWAAAPAVEIRLESSGHSNRSGFEQSKARGGGISCAPDWLATPAGLRPLLPPCQQFAAGAFPPLRARPFRRQGPFSTGTMEVPLSQPLFDTVLVEGNYGPYSSLSLTTGSPPSRREMRRAAPNMVPRAGWSGANRMNPTAPGTSSYIASMPPCIR
jgi:hypothetical protein